MKEEEEEEEENVILNRNINAIGNVNMSQQCMENWLL